MGSTMGSPVRSPSSVLPNTSTGPVPRSWPRPPPTLEQIERCLRGLGSIGVPTFAYPAIELPNGGCLHGDGQLLGWHTTNHTTCSHRGGAGRGQAQADAAEG